jgi:hypothetical protein
LNSLTVIAKIFINLNVFGKDLDMFCEPAQEIWKRNVFTMYDEAQNLIGRTDLSVSFVKRRRDLMNIPQAPSNTVVEKMTGSKPLLKPTPASTKPQTILTENNIDPERNPSSMSFNPKENQTVSSPPKNQTFSQTQQAQPSFPEAELTLKTIVEGNYCPPVMFFKKVKKFEMF